ncbi:hypothetical protein J2Y03_003917 [Neobacillus niacini]|uniref:hypothetical protein n=1 Tax=Neobacillus niacini TaxID=86668 RepID=UPI0028673B37|nr:hypothetical protein [Neobacillus niacini]MDR7078860.1 hypothetical protein [Neobacillus niacini]
MLKNVRNYSTISYVLRIYEDQIYFKRILPYIIVLLLFQDLLAINIGIISKPLANIINHFDELLILICLPFILLYYKERKWKFDFLFHILMVVFSLGLISSIIHKVPLIILIQGAILMFKGFIVLFIFRSISFTAADLNKFSQLFKKITYIVLFFAVIDALFSHQFRGLINTDHKFDIRMGIISIQSIFTHPSLYGWFLAIVGFYLLSSYSVNNNKKSGLKSLVLFIASIFSFRFKTTIAILFNSLFVLVQQRFNIAGLKKFRQSKAFLPVIIVSSIVAIVVLYAVVQLSVLTIQRYITIDYTESARKALYIFGFIIAFTQFPFGVGYGRYGSWTAREYYSPVYVEYELDKIYGLYSKDPKWATDTYWPSIMGEVGIIGAILLLSIFIYFILYIYIGYKTIQKMEYKVFFLFSIMIITQSLIESLGEQVYNSGPQYLFIFAIIGISLSIIQEQIGELHLGIANKFRKILTKMQAKKEF